MSKEQGYIKVYRSIRENFVWNSNEPFDKRSAWIDLLMMANHAERKFTIDGNVKTIMRGQLYTSVRHLQDRWKWSSKGKVVRFLNTLEVQGMIVRSGDTHGTTISLVNYDFYQGERDTDRYTDGYTDGTPTGTQTDHKQIIRSNVKNVNKKGRGGRIVEK